MSIGGPYALAIAARHPERVASLAVVAAPSQEECLRRSEPGSVAAVVARNRPEFAAWVATVAPDDPDDDALTARFLTQHPPEDAALLAQQPAPEVAAAVREALAHDDGYLRDAAITFRHWDFNVADVTAPTTLWYGEQDSNAPPDNGRELADRLPHATLRLLPTTHLATLLTGWSEILAPLRH